MEVRLHSAGAASRLAALLLPQIFPIFSVVAPCQPGASPPSVQRRTSTTGCPSRHVRVRNLGTDEPGCADRAFDDVLEGGDHPIPRKQVAGARRSVSSKTVAKFRVCEQAANRVGQPACIRGGHDQTTDTVL